MPKQIYAEAERRPPRGVMTLFDGGVVEPQELEVQIAATVIVDDGATSEREDAVVLALIRALDQAFEEARDKLASNVKTDDGREALRELTRRVL